MRYFPMKKIVLLIALFTSLAFLVEPQAEVLEDTKKFIDAGVRFQKSGDHQKAADQFKQAIRNQPGYPDSYLQLGFSLQTLKKYRQAISAYKTGLGINNRHPYAPEAYYNMGVSSDELGEGPDAIDHMKKSLQAYTNRSDYGGVYKVGRYIEHLSKKYPNPGTQPK